ncbi:MAG: polysaccharide deacetylase family protein, partial [Hyphomicrobiaceae bacterium]
FRFPYLSDPAYAIKYLRKRDTAMFSIDVDSNDYRTRSATVVIRNIEKQLKQKGRGIILFHDIQASTAKALSRLLSDLKAQGYRVVHIVPKSGQTTLASFDQRVASRHLGSLSVKGLDVSRRSVVRPAWEPRGNDAYRQAKPVQPQSTASAQRSPPVAAQPAQAPKPASVTPRDDWRVTVFSGN